MTSEDRLTSHMRTFVLSSLYNIPSPRRGRHPRRHLAFTLVHSVLSSQGDKLIMNYIGQQVPKHLAEEVGYTIWFEVGEQILLAHSTGNLVRQYPHIADLPPLSRMSIWSADRVRRSPLWWNLSHNWDQSKHKSESKGTHMYWRLGPLQTCRVMSLVPMLHDSSPESVEVVDWCQNQRD
jgi:hypothetical protein